MKTTSPVLACHWNSMYYTCIIHIYSCWASFEFMGPKYRSWSCIYDGISNAVKIFSHLDWLRPVSAWFRRPHRKKKLMLTTWTLVRSLPSPLQSVLLLKAACIWAVEFVWTLYGRRLIIVGDICSPIAVSWQNLYAFFLPLECGLHYFIFGSLKSANNKCSVFLSSDRHFVFFRAQTARHSWDARQTIHYA